MPTSVALAKNVRRLKPLGMGLDAFMKEDFMFMINRVHQSVGRLFHVRKKKLAGNEQVANDSPLR